MPVARMLHIQHVGIFVGLIIGSLTFGHPPATAGSGASTADSGDFAQAVAFRSKFGLTTNPELVLRSLTDGSFEAQPWGIPLSAAEIAELDQRAKARRTFAPAVSMALALSGSAGAYIDQRRGGIPVFLTTGDDSDLAERVTRLLPIGADFEVRTVEWTLVQLMELHSRIVEERDMLRQVNIEVQTVGIDESANAVTLGVEGLTDASISLFGFEVWIPFGRERGAGGSGR